MNVGNKQDKIRPSIEFDYPTGQHGRIPSFNSVEEEAEFWDTHDFTDYWEESRPVEVIVLPKIRKDRRITVRLNEPEGEEIEQKAQSLGIGSSTLIRMWVKERLENERKAS